MTEPTPARSLREDHETQKLVQAAFELARELGISRLLVQADELRDVQSIETVRASEQIIWLTTGDSESSIPRQSRDVMVRIPSTQLSRISQINMGFFLAVLEKSVDLDESVLCLTGVAGSERIDTILIANPRRDFPWLLDSGPEGDAQLVAPREAARVIEIALRFAEEGREGRPIGTIFVIGDMDDLAPCVRQIILNPCEGHAKRQRNIHNPQFVETLREFAAMDGAFIVSKKGVVESAGTYLDAPISSHELPPGLGARHAAAAAITACATATAVVVSESSGTVRVFHDGRSILELEKPQPGGALISRKS
jgi:hypothetical protein